MRRHPVDPPAQHRAAAAMGRLVAQGLLNPAECLAPLVAAAERAAPGADRVGLRTRLAHRLLDSADAWEEARARAGREIGAAIAPLLAAWAAADAILTAAGAANARLGAPLRRGEVAAVAARTAEMWLRRGGRAGR